MLVSGHGTHRISDGMFLTHPTVIGARVRQAQKLAAASLRGRELVLQTRSSLRTYGMKGKDGVLAEVPHAPAE